MVRIVPYRQPEMMTEFRDEVSRLMDQFFGRNLFAESGELAAWMSPSVDIAESEDQYEVSLELPGFKPDEVKIEVDNGNLFISGQHREERDERGKTWHRAERQFGQFRRVFALGDVQPDQVQAEFRDGVLRIVAPKSESSRRRKIEVRSGDSGAQKAEVSGGSTGDGASPEAQPAP